MAQDTERTARAVAADLARHPRADDLARLAQTATFSAFDERRTSLDAGLDEAAARLGLDEPTSDTPFGNVLRALRKGAGLTGPERDMLGALVARGVALAPPDPGEASARVAEALAWIGGHTAIDPLPFVDASLALTAEPLWAALVRLLERHDEGTQGGFDRPSAVVAASAIGRSDGSVAEQHRAALRVALRDPTLRRLVGASAETPGVKSVAIAAEEGAAPRSPALTVLLTVTFILPVVAVSRLFARLALRLRRPANVDISAEGVRVRSRTELLGRTILEHETFLPASGLMRARREVRYPRLATYAGIAALLLGSYVGLRLVIDGARSGSPELLGLGLGLLLAGLGVDYLLSIWPSRAPARCRVVFEPRKGRAVSLRDVDRELADRALQLLSTSR
jgi:hypothetical protein